MQHSLTYFHPTTPFLSSPCYKRGKKRSNSLFFYRNTIFILCRRRHRLVEYCLCIVFVICFAFVEYFSQDIHKWGGGGGEEAHTYTEREIYIYKQKALSPFVMADRPLFPYSFTPNSNHIITKDDLKRWGKGGFQ